jgi:hypothetical protein
MYFNFKITGLSVDEIWLLQLARQNSNKENRDIIQPYLEGKDLSSLEKYIQKTKEGHFILSKVGREIYEKATTSYIVEDVDVKLTDWLVKHYQSNDRLGGNKKKMSYYIAAIREELNLSPTQLFVLIQTYVNDDKAFTYSRKAENLLFNPGNVFRTKFSPDESPLCQYYEQYEDSLKDKFAAAEPK